MCPTHNNQNGPGSPKKGRGVVNITTPGSDTLCLKFSISEAKKIDS